MKLAAYLRHSLVLFLVVALLSPTLVLANGDGRRHFRTGMKHEVAEEWDKAAEAFALAVAANPKNPEYRLHLRRSLFNASQMYMKIGRTAAEEKDYEGAYIAFRRAYAFDPVNELARSEMARMIRLQEDLQNTGGDGLRSDAGTDPRMVRTAGPPAPDFPMPQRLEKLRDVLYPSGVNLQFVVKELARDLDLNVLFDVESRLEQRQVRIELRNVTAAKALDYIFIQEGLFFQRVGPRTILVALSARRTVFQQLVLRTFYLANANPKDVKTIIQTAIPAQPGRSQTIVLEDPVTNSVTIRDTEENIRLIGQLISSLDKDRAEVVMDVAIYEVNKSDLLQFGNQIGTIGRDGTLFNLGGVGLPFGRAGSTGPITSGMPFPNIDVASIAIGLPVSTIAALQSRSDTKLIASTQIHAFNNEDSSARIGQRVPVRTAQFQTGTGTVGGVVSDVINYEQVGLTLKFRPIVFPNQDVQVAMEIESKDITGTGSGLDPLTPNFIERTIKGTARVQNNKTLLLASVAQGFESRTRTGLPLIGLIPILGRLFTAPSRDNRQVDIVIAITPRVIRAPAILPEDEIERPTGSVAVPTQSSLEAMIIQEERDEYFASIRRMGNNAQVQLPDQPQTPAFIRSSAEPEVAAVQPEVQAPVEPRSVPEGLNLRPIETSARSLNLTQTSAHAGNGQDQPALASLPVPETVRADQQASPTAELLISPPSLNLKAGERAKVSVMISGQEAFRSGVLGFSFDHAKLAIRSVSMGDVFGVQLAGTEVRPFLNQNGRMFVSLSAGPGGSAAPVGVFAEIEVEALEDGPVELAFEKDVLNLLTANGKNFILKY